MGPQTYLGLKNKDGAENLRLIKNPGLLKRALVRAGTIVGTGMKAGSLKANGKGDTSLE